MSLILGEIEGALHIVIPEIIAVLKELIGFPGKIYEPGPPPVPYRKNLYSQEQQPSDFNPTPVYDGLLVVTNVITDRYVSVHSEIDPYEKEMAIYDRILFPDDSKVELEYHNQIWAFRIQKVKFHGIKTGQPVVYKHLLIPFNKIGEII